MDKNAYKLVGKFNCCGKTMVTVIMNGAACTMSEPEYNGIIEAKQKFRNKNKLDKSA